MPRTGAADAADDTLLVTPTLGGRKSREGQNYIPRRANRRGHAARQEKLGFRSSVSTDGYR